MKQEKYLSIILISLFTVLACSEMNDKHDFYLQEGEIIYIGRVDSAKILPGHNRFLLRYWITDMRTKELLIYWNQMENSLMVPIPVHQSTDSIDVLIGDKENIIPEGNYTFQLVSSDGGNLRSIVFERLGNVYGPQFASTLSNRFVKSVDYNPDKQEVTISWGEPSSSKEIGVEITYFTGEEKNVVLYTNGEMDSKMVLNDVDVEKGVSYKTIFLPEPIAIDTFFTASVPLVILQNIALNKPVKTSSNLNSSYDGTKAVDGVISTDSRWISIAGEGLEHWIEVDLGKEYNLYSFKVHKHLYNEFLLPNFTLQVQKDGEWVDVSKVENYLGEMYELVFPEEVVTDKVRLFVPIYPNNMVRLMELYVYVKY